MPVTSAAQQTVANVRGIKRHFLFCSQTLWVRNVARTRWGWLVWASTEKAASSVPEVWELEPSEGSFSFASGAWCCLLPRTSAGALAQSPDAELLSAACASSQEGDLGVIRRIAWWSEVPKTRGKPSGLLFLLLEVPSVPSVRFCWS